MCWSRFLPRPVGDAGCDLRRGGCHPLVNRLVLVSLIGGLCGDCCNQPTALAAGQERENRAGIPPSPPTRVGKQHDPCPGGLLA